MGLIDFLNRRKQAQQAPAPAPAAAVVQPVQGPVQQAPATEPAQTAAEKQTANKVPVPIIQPQNTQQTQQGTQPSMQGTQPSQGTQGTQPLQPLQAQQPTIDVPAAVSKPQVYAEEQLPPAPPQGLHMSQQDYTDARNQGYTDKQLLNLYGDYNPDDATPFFQDLYKKSQVKKRQYTDKQLKSRRNLASLADSLNLITQSIAASGGAHVQAQQGTATSREQDKQDRLRQLYDQQAQQYAQGLYNATLADVQAGRTQQASKKMDLLNKLKEAKSLRLSRAKMAYDANKDYDANKLKEQELAIRQYAAQARAKTAQDNANTSRLKLLSDLKKANKDDNIQVVADMGRVVNISKSALTSPAFIGRAYAKLIKSLPESELPKGTPIKNWNGDITGYKDISQKDMQAFVFKHINDPKVFAEVEDAARIERGKRPLIRMTAQQQQILKNVADNDKLTDKEQAEQLIKQLNATGMGKDSIKYVVSNAMPDFFNKEKETQKDKK